MFHIVTTQSTGESLLFLAKGDNFLIVYADDFVAGFQYKWEAENYYKLLKERMEKFGLQLEESKSRLLQSGAYIARAKLQKNAGCRRRTLLPVHKDRTENYIECIEKS